VDDEANVLAGYTRQLRKQFDLRTALGGDEAIELMTKEGPFAVIVTDMRMPGMSGLDLLSRIRQSAPLTIRMMLTGNSDQQTAMDAVNEGSIFRFLTKPCPVSTFVTALKAGLEQYRLVTAEKELLEETLRGSIKVLTEVLSLVNPVAFGRAMRVQRLVKKLAIAVGAGNSWQLEVASMLSQLGCVTVPEPVLLKMYRGSALTSREEQMVHHHPQIGHDLISKIPRLESVAEMVAYQDKRYDGQGMSKDDVHGESIPIGARILKAALDYDCQESRLHDKPAAMNYLKSHASWYDPQILGALEVISRQETNYSYREVMLFDLKPGMVLAAGVLNEYGAVLVAKGQEITETLLYRLQNIATHSKLQEPISILRASDS
jgi:response regulator RpfG family c-di-GMP phosphodiesterase